MTTHETSQITRLAGVIGDPIAHSLSPAMHNAAFAALGMKGVYLAFHVKAAQLRNALMAVPALKMLGLNVTVPHKEAAAQIVHGLSPEAQALGAVNCVIPRGEQLWGDNTDARGLANDLQSLGVNLAGRAVVIIGAGGAAAAVIMACRRAGASRIVVANRTLDRARNLIARLAPDAGAAMPLDALRDRAVMAEAALVVNATSVGTTNTEQLPMAYELTSPDCFFYDLFYSREPTRFLRPALALGRKAADGAGMLLHQGTLAFQLFTGVEAPVEAMRQALAKCLGRAC